MRPIDADALMNKIKKEITVTEKEGKGIVCSTIVFVLSNLLDWIEDAPTIEAKPVVHAHWENEHLNRYGHLCHCCSNCGFSASHKDKNWCANCGAQMDEEVSG